MLPTFGQLKTAILGSLLVWGAISTPTRAEVIIYSLSAGKKIVQEPCVFDVT